MPQTLPGDSRILYVPIESRVREFDAKLLLSLFAVQAGFQVVIGPKWLFGVNVPRLPRGLFVFKTLNLLDAPAILAFKKFGHVTIAWDEEGPALDAMSFLKSINGDAVGHADVIYSWGERQTEMLAGKYPGAADKIETTGNPRWDLLRPEWRSFYEADATALRERYGRIILINTNFSFYNSWFEDKIGGVLKMGARTGAFEIGNPADMQMLQTIYTFEKNMFAAFTALLPALSAAFPGHTIILRPHPIEQHERWDQHVAPLANVKTLHEGGVIPWLMAAEAVIMSRCTTGFEALTLGRPVLAYCSYNSPLVDSHLANMVCPRALDQASLIDSLKQFTSDPATFEPARIKGMELLSHHIAGMSGEPASAAIVTSLAGLADKHERERGPLARAFVIDQGLEDYPRSDYLALKFPPVSLAEMNRMIGRFAALDPKLGAVAVTQIAESCFLLRRNA